MSSPAIDVIATTISGSISDWSKVKHIVRLFQERGMDDVTLSTADSHKEAREITRERIAAGGRIIISAGGSGTFNAVLEGCLDSQLDLNAIKLGFMRKGSADLIGKVLGMPDDIEEAIEVFVDSIRFDRTVPCDIILAESAEGDVQERHFVGYGGAEIFGEVPHFTENRFIKYYKGILSQMFGDLGPFFVGASLASTRKAFRQIIGKRRKWRLIVDGYEEPYGYYQVFIIVNGDLGKDLPLARGVPLGSGNFHIFALKDLGISKLIGQFKHTWNASVKGEPDRWGFKAWCVNESLKIQPQDDAEFEINVDGSTMVCRKSADFRICNRINLISGK